MNKIIVEILNLDTDQVIGVLDLQNKGDFPLKLTKETSTITDIAARRGVYSLDFNLPDTPNNRRLLFGVAFVQAAGSSLNILQKKSARIKINNTELERGFIRFSQGVYEGNYRATFYGGNNDWVDKLNELYLNQLGWTNLGEPLSGVEYFEGLRIGVISDGDQSDYDISYPYIDRNTGSARDQLRPVLYVKKVIQRMFEAIGYTISSTFLSSTFMAGDGGEFKGLVLDPAISFDTDPDQIEALRIEATTDRFTQGQDPNTWDTNFILGNKTNNNSPDVVLETSLPGFYNVELVDLPNSYDPITGIWTAPNNGTFNIRVEIPNQAYSVIFAYITDIGGTPSNWTNIDLFGGSTNFSFSGNHPPKVTGYIVKNNIGTTTINGTILYQSSQGNFVMDQLMDFTFSASQGDTIQVFFTMSALSDPSHLDPPRFQFQMSPTAAFWRWHPGYNSVLKIQPAARLALGDLYTINDYIPKEINCLSLLQDFKLMFNWYFEVDINRKIVTIETRDDYFLDLSQAKDITNIIDLDSSIKIDRKTNYKKELSFRYKEDSKDGYLARWNKINNRTYAEYTHTLSDRFDTGEVVYETKILAPTIQRLMPVANMITSTILPNYDLNENVGKGITKEYAPRVYQLIRNQQFNSAGHPYRTSLPLVFTYGIMEEFGNVPTIDDKKLTFNGANGLVDQFYAKTISNIEGSAIVKLKVKISLWQFKNWNMRQLVYISDPAEIKGYYVVEAIENYNINGEELASFRLLTYKDWQAANIPGGGTNVSLAVTTTQTVANNIYPILVNVNGVVLNCVDNNGNPMYKI